MTTQDAPHRHPTSTKSAVRLDRLDAVVGAGGVVSTVSAEKRAPDGLVEPDHPDQAPRGESGAGVVLSFACVHLR